MLRHRIVNMINVLDIRVGTTRNIYDKAIEKSRKTRTTISFTRTPLTIKSLHEKNIYDQ
jgi:hypothetical protein